MAGGVASLNGQSAPRLVEEDPSHEPEPAQILLLLTVEKIVTEKLVRNRNVTNKTARLTADGAATKSGQSALKIVVQELEPELDLAQTLFLHTMEINV